MLPDAHIHLPDLLDRDPDFPARFAAEPNLVLAAAHDAKDWTRLRALAAPPPAGPGLRFLSSFGIHPQWPVMDHAGLLEGLATGGAIAAVGEAGFDFFGDRPERVRNEENLRVQTAAFELQLELAERTGLPLLLHVRKGMDLVFGRARRLARLRACVFHAWPGTEGEALALLDKGIPAYFSFGASVLNGHKRAEASCAALPLERLLAETDAPWQPPKGEEFCRHEHLSRVVDAMAGLRGLPRPVLEEALMANFAAAYPGASELAAELAAAGGGAGGPR